MKRQTTLNKEVDYANSKLLSLHSELTSLADQERNVAYTRKQETPKQEERANKNMNERQKLYLYLMSFLSFNFKNNDVASSYGVTRTRVT